jgi:hypothetical protein
VSLFRKEDIILDPEHKALLDRVDRLLGELYARTPEGLRPEEKQAFEVERDAALWALAAVETEIQGLLRKIDPQWARANLRRLAAPPRRNLKMMGLGRFVWVLLAGSSGTRQDAQDLTRYGDLCDTWIGLYFASDILRSITLPNHEYDGTGAMEAIRRLAPTQTKFLWISRTIVECGIRALNAREGNKFEEDCLDSIYALVRRYGNDAGLWFGESRNYGVRPASDTARQILDAASVRPGAFPGKLFRDVVLGRNAEMTPFLKFDDEYFPADIRSALMALELSFFELVGQQGWDKGAVYEDAVRLAIRELAPAGLEVKMGDSNIKPGLPTDPLQVDLVLVDAVSQTAFIGEVKCYAPGKYPDGTAFGVPMFDAIGQALTRLKNFGPESALVANEWRVEGDDFVRCYGLVVPNYASGQGPWRAETLRSADPDFDVAVIPLHQLLLTISLLASGEELAAYMDLRSKLLRAGVSSYDEHEFVRMFLLKKGRSTQEILDQLVDPATARILLVNYVLPASKCINKDRPTQLAPWRHYFLRYEERIDPFGPANTELINFRASGHVSRHDVGGSLPEEWIFHTTAQAGSLPD